MEETAALNTLKGVGEKTEKLFWKLSIYQVGDLLHHYPKTYDIYEGPAEIAGLQEGMTVAVQGTLDSALTVKRGRRAQIVTGSIRDATGSLQVNWYHMPYLKNTMSRGRTYVLRGTIVKKKQQLYMEQPAVFDVETYQLMRGTMQPMYPLTEGVTNKQIGKLMRQALGTVDLRREYLPGEIRERWNLAEYRYALEQIHFPKDMHHMMLARERLVFDEFFLFILALRSLKGQQEELANSFGMEPREATDQVIRELPYALTGAQKKVWDEVERDLTGPAVMARLVQGDVGSGKTIVAVLALILTAENGYQGSLMVPTEVLAAQHYESICSLFSQQQLPYEAVLLTGSMTAREKRLACEKIREGRAKVIIGTHALIQEKVEYQNLALVITDEQHRFGVKQREALSNKGKFPHTLVMSATPIPRTLAVILYGDLDISVIDELPANRLPIKNCVVGTEYRDTAYQFIRREVEAGRQAYVICPMVEESEAIEAENVMEYARKVESVMPPNIRVEILHGRMKPKEKNEVMQRFLANQIQVLVSTTVVEVGVNVPNATVMMIENAERFGLAQLHQLRGRVGRGRHQSFCILVHSTDSKRTRQRLEILNHSNDGFYIASQDLKLRGPGDLFGIRQSGLMNFKLGDVFQDAQILQRASEAAAVWMAKQQELGEDKDGELKKRLEQYLHEQTGMLNL